MFETDHKTRYLIINIYTGETSHWIESENVLCIKILEMAGKKSYFLKDSKTAISSVKFNREEETYPMEPIFLRKLMIFDNHGRMIPPHKLNFVFYDFFGHSYDMRVPERNWNRKKKLRKKDSGYRREPVAGTGRKQFHTYVRPIRYKNTILLSEDDQCKEYGIKPYKKKIDKWDIEPFREYSKSWKDNTKRKRQWKIDTCELLGN